MLSAQKEQKRLFDYLVGAGEQLRRQVEAERFGSLHIDHELVFGRRLHWKVGRFLALENSIGITGGAPILIEIVWTVRD